MLGLYAADTRGENASLQLGKTRDLVCRKGPHAKNVTGRAHDCLTILQQARNCPVRQTRTRISDVARATAWALRRSSIFEASERRARGPCPSDVEEPRLSLSRVIENPRRRALSQPESLRAPVAAPCVVRRSAAVRARLPAGCCARRDPQPRTRRQSAPRAGEGPTACASSFGFSRSALRSRALGLVVGSSHARGRTRRASPACSVSIRRGAGTPPAPMGA